MRTPAGNKVQGGKGHKGKGNVKIEKKLLTKTTVATATPGGDKVRKLVEDIEEARRGKKSARAHIEAKYAIIPLKDICRIIGASVGGRKADVIKRLLYANEAGNLKKYYKEPPVSDEDEEDEEDEDEEDEDEEEEDEEEDKENKKPTSKKEEKIGEKVLGVILGKKQQKIDSKELPTPRIVYKPASSAASSVTSTVGSAPPSSTSTAKTPVKTLTATSTAPSAVVKSSSVAVVASTSASSSAVVATNKPVASGVSTTTATTTATAATKLGAVVSKPPVQPTTTTATTTGTISKPTTTTTTTPQVSNALTAPVSVKSVDDVANSMASMNLTSALPKSSSAPSMNWSQSTVGVEDQLLKSIDTTDYESMYDKSIQPKELLVNLMPYQLAGVKWLCQTDLRTPNGGGMLCDDMGLGKTVQTIALMLRNKPAAGTPRPTLIVCPLSTLDQWNKEIQSKVQKGVLNVYCYYGTNRHDSILSKKERAKFNAIDAKKSTDKKKIAPKKANKKKKNSDDEEDDEKGARQLRKKNTKKSQKADDSDEEDDSDDYENSDQSDDDVSSGDDDSEFVMAMKKLKVSKKRKTKEMVDTSGEVKALSDLLQSNYDVVLTTYNLVASEYSAAMLDSDSSEEEGDEKKENGKEKKTKKKKKQSDPVPSVLMTTKWHRVVLDEAHTIKNPSSLTSKACRYLKASTRWCLTGTPIQNSLDDLFSLLAFLKVGGEQLQDKRWWSTNITKPAKRKNPQALARLQALIQPILLRRTKDQKLPMVIHAQEGSSIPEHIEEKAIVELPPCTVETVKLPMSKEERELYDELYSNAKAAFRSMLSNKNMFASSRDMNGGTKYLLFLETLTRVRQCCDHYYIVLMAKFGSGIPAAELAPSTLNDLFDDLIAEIRAMNGDETKPQTQAEPDWKKACPICLCKPTSKEESALLTCTHALCKACAEAACLKDSKGAYICSFCTHGSGYSLLTKDAEAYSTASSDNYDEDVVVSTGKLGFKNVDGFRDTTKLIAMVRKLLQTKKDYIAQVAARKPKTKGRGKKQVAEAPAEDQGPEPHLEKSIVFSQFTNFLDLVEISLKRAGIKFERLDGRMTNQQRVAAIESFKTKPDVQVFLISLKAGSVGLNLTEASSVFLLDPWWNPAIEQQAIDRVMRIGQNRPVSVYRYIIENSIEEKILILQDNKRQIAQGVLSGNKSDVSKLTTDDMKKLFTD